MPPLAPPLQAEQPRPSPQPAVGFVAHGGASRATRAHPSPIAAPAPPGRHRDDSDRPVSTPLALPPQRHKRRGSAPARAVRRGCWAPVEHCSPEPRPPSPLARPATNMRTTKRRGKSMPLHIVYAPCTRSGGAPAVAEGGLGQALFGKGSGCKNGPYRINSEFI